MTRMSRGPSATAELLVYTAWKCICQLEIVSMYTVWLVGASPSDPVRGLCSYTPLGDKVSQTLCAHPTSNFQTLANTNIMSCLGDVIV